MVSGGVEEKVEKKNEKEKRENIWPAGKEKEEIIGRGKIFGQRRKRGKISWRRKVMKDIHTNRKKVQTDKQKESKNEKMAISNKPKLHPSAANLSN